MGNKHTKVLFIGGILFLGTAIVTGVVTAKDFSITAYDQKHNVHKLITDKEEIEKMRRESSNNDSVNDPRFFIPSLITDEITEDSDIFKESKQLAEEKNDYLSKATLYTEEKETKQFGKIDEYLTVDNTLVNVTFCKTKTLKTRQIFIDGVDVVQRLAYIISNDLTQKDFAGNEFGQGICNAIPSTPIYTKGILETRDVKVFDGMDDGKTKITGKTYWVDLPAAYFAISPSMNEIFIIDAYDGALSKIGKLK